MVNIGEKRQYVIENRTSTGRSRGRFLAYPIVIHLSKDEIIKVIGSGIVTRQLISLQLMQVESGGVSYNMVGEFRNVESYDDSTQNVVDFYGGEFDLIEVYCKESRRR